MSSDGIPFDEADITPEMSEYARKLLEQHDLAASSPPCLTQELAASVSPEVESDVEVADVTQVSGGNEENSKGKSSKERGGKVSKKTVNRRYDLD
jgi:hypothetical protein